MKLIRRRALFVLLVGLCVCTWLGLCIKNPLLEFIAIILAMLVIILGTDILFRRYRH
jgi:hypothetical protein